MLQTDGTDGPADKPTKPTALWSTVHETLGAAHETTNQAADEPAIHGTHRTAYFTPHQETVGAAVE